MRLFAGLFRREHTFALVIGFTDGILTALTLAAGRVVSAHDPADLSLARRISAAASLSGMFIFFTAASFPTEKIVPLLLQRALQDPSPSVRAAARWVLESRKRMQTPKEESDGAG